MRVLKHLFYILACFALGSFVYKGWLSGKTLIDPIQSICHVYCEDQSVAALAFSPDNLQLAIGSTSYSSVRGNKAARVATVEIASGKVLAEYYLASTPTTISPALSGNEIAVGTARCKPHDRNHTSHGATYRNRGSITVLNSQSLQVEKRLSLKWGVYGSIFSDDGKILATIGAAGDNDIHLQLWSWPELEELAIFNYTGTPPAIFNEVRRSSLLFSNDGRWLLASVNSEKSINTKASRKVLKPQTSQLVFIDMSSLSEAAVVEYRRPLSYLELMPDNMVLLGDRNDISVANIDFENQRLSQDYGLDDRHQYRFLNKDSDTFTFLGMGYSYHPPEFTRRTVGVILIFKNATPFEFNWRMIDQLYMPLSNSVGRVRAIATSRDRRYLAIPTGYGDVGVWEIDYE